MIELFDRRYSGSLEKVTATFVTTRNMPDQWPTDFRLQPPNFLAK